VDCPTSQYLSALLIAAPLAPPGTLTEIDVPLLNEKPYVEMTLSYLDKQGLLAGPARRKAGAGPETGIRYKSDFSYFRIPGGASYKPMNGPVPGDFSSAAFPAAAAVITGNPLVLSGLDMEDTQGDKVFFDYLERMGCTVKTTGAETGNGPDLTVIPPAGRLRGGTFDLNATPDMLPVMAALAVYAGGDTLLTNAAHARLKETDRIAVMAEELGRLGISCEERHDGLLIRGRSFRTPPEGPGENRNPPVLDGRGDHRVVMALACAALGFSGPAEIAGAEAADVTYPGFMELLGAEEYT
jgi:3-phosphoshikimate 1-carboxyvinyltransferase